MRQRARTTYRQRLISGRTRLLRHDEFLSMTQILKPEAKHALPSFYVFNVRGSKDHRAARHWLLAQGGVSGRPDGRLDCGGDKPKKFSQDGSMVAIYVFCSLRSAVGTCRTARLSALLSSNTKRRVNQGNRYSPVYPRRKCSLVG